jgi:hypothetical protein
VVEVKPEPVVEVKPEPVVEAPAAPVQTIVVDTEPSVRFTNIDTVFQSTTDENTLEEVDIDDDVLQFVDSNTSALDSNLDYEEL